MLRYQFFLLARRNWMLEFRGKDLKSFQMFAIAPFHFVPDIHYQKTHSLP
jgi:hypothetical protein